MTHDITQCTAESCPCRLQCARHRDNPAWRRVGVPVSVADFSETGIWGLCSYFMGYEGE